MSIYEHLIFQFFTLFYQLRSNIMLQYSYGKYLPHTSLYIGHIVFSNSCLHFNYIYLFSKIYFVCVKLALLITNL